MEIDLETDRDRWMKNASDIAKDYAKLLELSESLASAIEHEVSRSRRHLAASTIAALENYKKVNK